MRNRSGSLWLDRHDAHAASWMPLAGDIEVEVAIVGGGIVGAAVARLLAEGGMTVALLEANRIGGGVTGNSTAKATSFQGTDYTNLIKELGVDGARLIVDGDRAALDVIRSWSNSGLVDQIEAVDHWAWASTPSGFEHLEAEHAAARTLGVDTRWASSEELTFGTHALGVADQLLIEPALLCRSLAAHAAELGAVVAEHSRVQQVDVGDEVVLTTQEGVRVHAGRVILATQLPILDRSLVFAACSFRRSHVLALELPDARARVPAMYTGIDSGGLSLRPAKTTDGRDVVVVAGHGHSLDEDEDGTHIDELARHARALLGTADAKVTHAWLAHDAFPSDGRPFIGPMHGSDNIHIATGFGGWGLARGVSAALTIASLIRRGHARWEHPCDARRLRVYATRDVVQGGVRIAVSLAKDRIGLPHDGQIDELQPGQGDVFRIGTHAVAVSRDEHGTLHAVDAACTHLGCIVRHDAERNQWQCPCHGSRFTCNGTPLSGPATTPLAPFEL